MRLPKTLETIALLVAVFFPFYWYNQTYLSKFSLQLVGLLILCFAFHNWLARRWSKSDSFLIYQKIINMVIITVLTLMLILSTGGAGSMLFWLLDFLLFFAAVFSRPRAGLTLTLAVGLAFLLNETQLTTPQLINLISLLLMAPLAAFFSTQYSRLITTQKQVKILSNQAKQEETATLLWLSLNFREKIEQAIDLVSQISTNLSRIPDHQRDQLKSLYQDLKSLWQSGQELEQKIDKLTD